MTDGSLRHFVLPERVSALLRARENVCLRAFRRMGRFLCTPSHPFLRLLMGMFAGFKSPSTIVERTEPQRCCSPEPGLLTWSVRCSTDRARMRKVVRSELTSLVQRPPKIVVCYRGIWALPGIGGIMTGSPAGIERKSRWQEFPITGYGVPCDEGTGGVEREFLKGHSSQGRWLGLLLVAPVSPSLWRDRL